VVNQIVTEKPSQGASVKNRILGILRGEPGAFFSGENLAAKLGVSRVAVWKAVKSLHSVGYPILTGEKGYCWRPVLFDDFLYPWEFGERESFFHHLITTDSTMNRAAELAAKGCSGGTIITAGEQTAGRGRNGRPWASSEGGLFFNLLERPAINAAEYFRVSLALQIAAARSLTKICGKPVQPRWPNDLYAEGKKIAGLLTEFHAEGDRLLWISLGMGVNVNNAPYSRESANCAGIAGRPISRQEVLLAILNEWDLVKKDMESPTLHKEWNALVWGKGKKAVATESKKNVITNGIFMGIDELGRGILKGENQNRFFFHPGTVSFQFKEI
jgi:BirA family biotin operon repressor/biotin-[acetyl-CoA-carboxylase] ligase